MELRESKQNPTGFVVALQGALPGIAEGNPFNTWMPLHNPPLVRAVSPP
jgi:hypothetical protein